MIYLKNGVGFAFEIEDFDATVDESIWALHSHDPIGTTWDVIGGRFVEMESREMMEARIEARHRILELKQNLLNTDYKAIKFAEGLISEEEFAEAKAQRQAWRGEINRLEALIG